MAQFVAKILDKHQLEPVVINAAEVRAKARWIFILRGSIVDLDQNVDNWRAGVKANGTGGTCEGSCRTAN